MVEADVCIIGGGIMGSATAYYLSKEKGTHVLLVDQYSVANDYCSSNDFNRVFRYAYGKDEFYTRLAVESKKLWNQVETETRTQLLVPSGLLLVQGNNPEWNRFNEDSYNTLEQLNLEAEQLDEKELSERYPHFTADRAFIDPYGSVILASNALRTFADAAVKNGAGLRTGSAVVKISPRSSEMQTVELANGQEILAEKVVVTIGPWTNNLLPPGILRITPTRQQVLYFRPDKLDQYRPKRFPIFFAEDYYGIPAVGIDAVKTSHNGRNTPVTPESAKRSVDSEEVETCRQVLRRFIPELANGKLASSKVCLYDMTGDKDFAIGPDPDNHAIVYGYGFSGHGFKFAPLIGRTLARLALEKDPGFDTGRFNVTRHVEQVLKPE